MNPLKALQDHRQAMWLDFLSRGFIADGRLKKLIDEDGLRGVTSNPSIFEHAIGQTDEYDDAIKHSCKAMTIRRGKFSKRSRSKIFATQPTSCVRYSMPRGARRFCQHRSVALSRAGHNGTSPRQNACGMRSIEKT